MKKYGHCYWENRKGVITLKEHTVIVEKLTFLAKTQVKL